MFYVPFWRLNLIGLHQRPAVSFVTDADEVRPMNKQGKENYHLRFVAKKVGERFLFPMRGFQEEFRDYENISATYTEQEMREQWANGNFPDVSDIEKPLREAREAADRQG
jgi:hypothetical protein